MLLLLGGTSDCAPLAVALAQAGYCVLVSSATDVELSSGSHPRIRCRSGKLDAEQMASLVQDRQIRAIVDATHPYAVAVRSTAELVAGRQGIPYLSYMRPGTVDQTEGVSMVADHSEAARRCVETGKPVFLTIGSRNVMPYALEAKRAGVDLFARVLDHPDSHQACRDAGISNDHVVIGRGPFSVDENRREIRKFHAGVLVTKDSGDAGGVPEKIEAARIEGCEVIVVGRPQISTENTFQEIPTLVEKLKTLVKAPPCTVLALDLESILIPEIWETVARVCGVPELALTTRDIPNYGALMRQRISICRERGIPLSRLREIVAEMDPLPGALDFLEWAQKRALIVIVADTFYELAGPVMSKLGSPLMLCHSLLFDGEGYVSDYRLRNSCGKASAIFDFQRPGWNVAAVGDSFNDLEMLLAADASFLFRPSSPVLEAGVAFPAIYSFDSLQNSLTPYLQ